MKSLREEIKDIVIPTAGVAMKWGEQDLRSDEAIDLILNTIESKLPKEDSFVNTGGQGSQQFNDYTNGYNKALKDVKDILNG